MIELCELRFEAQGGRRILGWSQGVMFDNLLNELANDSELRRTRGDPAACLDDVSRRGCVERSRRGSSGHVQQGNYPTTGEHD